MGHLPEALEGLDLSYTSITNRGTHHALVVASHHIGITLTRVVCVLGQ